MGSPTMRVETVGRERQPVVVIDDFAPDAPTWREIARTRPFAPDTGHYPGLKAPVTRAYLEAVSETITGVLGDVFSMATRTTLLGAWYQIVTTPPAALKLVQRVPHFDATEPNRIAIVHYLSEADHGGTAFYRHRATGFETIGPDRVQPYFARLNADVAARGVPVAAYISEDSPDFERTRLFEARFNRALIYRSQSLHSGAIPLDATLSPDPMVGRLTVGMFLAGE